jgi:hypothetical protein
VTGMIRAAAKREVGGMGNGKGRLRVGPKVSKEPKEPKSTQRSQRVAKAKQGVQQSKRQRNLVLGCVR